MPFANCTLTLKTPAVKKTATAVNNTGSITPVAVSFATAAYWLMHIPVFVLLPLIDNLVFSFTLYRLKLRLTGWLEVLKGVAFLLLMALYYN